MRNNRVGWKADRRQAVRVQAREVKRARRAGDDRTTVLVAARNIDCEVRAK